jgi:SseB protein C-terminal domain
MKLSNPFSRRPTEELIAHALTFVGEQDGPPERMLKERLSELFAGCKNPLKAYLARVRYREARGESVCLCLSVSGGEEKPLLEAVHSLFAQQFNRAVHLDILFLNLKREEQVAAVCKPFYLRDSIH